MKWLKLIQGEKKEQILILLLAGILLLVIAVPNEREEPAAELSGSTFQQQNDRTPKTGTEESVEENLERRLGSILRHVAGAGEVRVMITLKSDGQKIVEKDQQYQGESEDRSSSEQSIYQRDGQGNEIPYVRETLTPQIAGVLVIAQGGGNAVTVKEITEAVMALFGIEAHKIKVMKMD